MSNLKAINPYWVKKEIERRKQESAKKAKETKKSESKPEGKG